MRKKFWLRILLAPVLILFLFSRLSFGQDPSISEYRIGPKDLLEITVIGFQELNRQYRVSEEGKIGLPYLGEVPVEGLSRLELERSLTLLLKEKYLENPQVTVTIIDHQSRRVFLIGAVTTPGPYELMGRLTLLKLISQAGGLTPEAGDEIIVIRQLPDGQKTSLKISVKNLLLEGDASLDIPLQADDVVSIPVDVIIQIYVTGQVREPGALESVRRSNIPTLLRAIAQAGGFTERASKGNVIIKRIDEAGKETRIKVNVDDIIKGKKKDIQLQENDVVIVSEKFF